MKLIRKSLTILVSLCLLSFAVLAQMSNSKLKVGKKGEIELKEPTKIGDATLEPATYVVQHRVMNDRHYVRFQKLVEVPDLNLEPTFEPTDAGVYACKTESAPSKFKNTTVLLDRDPRGARITKVEIKGENVVHVF